MKNNNENKENNKELEIKRTDIEFSESLKLKELADKKEINNNETKADNLNSIKKELENQIKIFNIFKELSKKTIYVYDIKKYGNSILIGSICHSIAFILFENASSNCF